MTATPGLFRSRDLFVHDGTKLRRIRLSLPVQAFLFALTVLLVGWSVFAAARIMTAPARPTVVVQGGGLKQLAAAAELRARAIEQRQELLAQMIAGGNVDPSALPETTTLAALPSEIAGPLARAEDKLAAEESAAAATLDERYRVATRELKKLGLSPNRLAVGGPFEPAAKADPTFKALFNSWKKLDQLQDSAIAVPADKPVRTAAFTSSFGVRSDPFRGSAAMHAGIDLAGPAGTPIYATAEGVVSSAGWHNGGYGNLIKLDHGRGIETRYAHLSSIAVRPGQRIKRGDVIGRMGSTGRSTGSHLHYEVRIDGRAVNPIPFMKSTDYLVAIRSRNGAAMDQVALGGPTKAQR
ncbi:M23 family metallopeptidase [Sphingomonas sp. GCM10030256]|uniref:M23 family metallopeptidase n=1 Tax=Sphingomonas sp. GCM10030256 TaxID=3273427 RepID=UPI003605AF20